MTDRVIGKMNFAKRILLASAAIAAVAGPVAIGLIAPSAIRGQQAAQAFEVVSVKPLPSDAQHMFYNFDAGRFRAELPLYGLIAIAYDLPLRTSARLTGGPDWVLKEGFSVEGKADLSGLSAKARETRMKLMLQTLLADRFNLVLHRETREMPIYALTVAKNGPKLQKSKIADEKDCPVGREDSNSCHVINGGMGRGLHAKAADMADVVQFAGYWADRPLIDKTGLTGLYELDTEGWSPMIPRPPRPDGPNTEDAAVADPTRPTLYMIFEKLGLKMEGTRGPVDTFVIEKAERPAAN